MSALEVVMYISAASLSSWYDPLFGAEDNDSPYIHTTPLSQNHTNPKLRATRASSSGATDKCRFVNRGTATAICAATSPNHGNAVSATGSGITAETGWSSTSATRMAAASLGMNLSVVASPGEHWSRGLRQRA
ncbi:uncharacterized protein FIBRA_06498 [Fibroporia radiculosa]|uniref:Uncharacterized protein n=1 Tax=Fibroporia radiculosa TaxID=599839 RepID=J4HZ75_9APHY|nr:uncharacterized protein FIBRA_06498 [Fibroporia radiculosa]CCM04327.1 predicted protein [Fibroporia radiculosa]